MFNPARFMATFARHGLLESAVVHAVGGDVQLGVGVREASSPAFDYMSADSVMIEFDRAAVILDVEDTLTFRGQLWRVYRSPEYAGPFTRVALQKVNP